MKLVLCCDYGLDDAVATCDALLHAQADGYSEVVLVAVGGNVPSEIALGNAKKLVANLRFPQVPVNIIDTTDIGQPSEYLKTIHGGDGMGDLFEEKECRYPVLAFESWIAQPLGEFVLVSLGPMTLVPQILNKGGCKRFIFMGGNIAETPNFHGYEFNHALNRAAFSEAVKFPHVAITMDTCRNPFLNVQENGVRGEGILQKMVMRSRELTFHSGEKGCYLWDDIAVKYLRHPEWFELYGATDKDGNALTVAKYVFSATYSDILEK